MCPRSELERPQGYYGYISSRADCTLGVPSERGLKMLKICFCLVLATWMFAALMTIVYSREIAQFIVEITR